MVPKGTPMLMNIYKVYPRSRYWTKDADCFRCVVANFEQESPRVWNTYKTERDMEFDGEVDVGD